MRTRAVGAECRVEPPGGGQAHGRREIETLGRSPAARIVTRYAIGSSGATAAAGPDTARG